MAAGGGPGLSHPVLNRAADAALWATSVAVLAATVVLSLGPPPPTGGVEVMDKVWHGLAYAAQTASLLLAAVWRPGRGPGPFPGAATAVGVGVLALGVGLEALQGLDPFTDRSFEVLDIVAGGAGVGLAAAGWSALRRRARARRQAPG